MGYLEYKHNYKEFKKSAPLIIFVHGAGSDQTLWSLLNRYFFFKGFSTLALNLPSHGDNSEKALTSIEDMASYVSKVVKKFSAKKKILVGHSMGSLICVSIIKKKLFKVYKSILIGTALPMLVNKSLLTLSKKNSKAAIMNMINWSLPSISSLRGSHLIGINLANFIYTVMEKTPDKVLFYDLNACNNYTVDENDLKKIKTSCLIICGELDIMTPLKKSHNLNKLLKNSRLEIIENCGHFHFHEKSSQVRRLISSYIES